MFSAVVDSFPVSEGPGGCNVDLAHEEGSHVDERLRRKSLPTLIGLKRNCKFWFFFHVGTPGPPMPAGLVQGCDEIRDSRLP